MVLFPKAKRIYWYVTDIWETFCAVPVSVEGNQLNWDLGDGYFEAYPMSRLSLYRTQEQADQKAKLLNKRSVV